MIFSEDISGGHFTCSAENKGNRLSSADEWKLYNNEMIKNLELACTEEDYIAGVPTTVVAVAYHVAPTTTANSQTLPGKSYIRCKYCSTL